MLPSPLLMACKVSIGGGQEGAQGCSHLRDVEGMVLWHCRDRVCLCAGVWWGQGDHRRGHLQCARELGRALGGTGESSPLAGDLLCCLQWSQKKGSFNEETNIL